MGAYIWGPNSMGSHRTDPERMVVLGVVLVESILVIPRLKQIVSMGV